MVHLLSVKNLKKIYPHTHEAAVDSISFHVNEAEILGLLGPNGSGKTTTIQMLLGTLSLTSGSISYFGKDFTTHRSDVLEHVSYASAYTSLPWLLTVEENLKTVGRLYNKSPQESETYYRPLLERFGLADKRTSRVSSLSAGQITRLMLIKAFFIQPKIVLLDEPTASLDPDMANEICEFILEQREKTKMAVLFTSHKMEEATEVCDRVIFLKSGKIIADDHPKRLAQTVSPFRVRLALIDGMKRVCALAEQRHFAYKVEHRVIEITVPESQIPSFLNDVGKGGIIYAHITIEEPSLEEYFLHIAKR